MELVSKKSEFAEIGMKAALAATTYPKFDRFCDGTIEAEDIARAFASVEGVPWETAFMIARNILADADSEPSLDGEAKGLNFVEFMTCLEGDAINFEQFLKDTREQFDKYMLEDEAEDIEKGKKSAGKGAKKEPSLKQKLKIQKALEEQKRNDRDKKFAEAEKRLRAKAAALGKDFDDFMKDKIEEEDDSMRERCKKAFEDEAIAVIEAKKASGNKKPAAGNNEEEGARATSEDVASPAETDKADTPQVGPPLELTDDMQQERMRRSGILKILAASASGLAAADKNGLADPYVQVKRGKVTKKTKVIMKTLSPVWEESLDFNTGKLKKPVSLRTVIAEGLKVDIMDKDGMFDADDVMGTVAKVDLTPLEKADSITYCEEVSTGGLLRFHVAWESGESVVDSAPTTDANERVQKKDEAAADQAEADQAEDGKAPGSAKQGGGSASESEKGAAAEPEEDASKTSADIAEGEEPASEKKKKKKKKKPDDSGELEVKQEL